MSSEIEVPETPNWLQELEAKRERRLKARLGHEAGAGAPCLKCGDKCPGLDLHFWRKCCKICKCSKEEHEVQDDDIYGWAQFQLLGSKPNKIKRKIVIPGKKDEVELDWIPKGHNETVDKYLKTLPPDLLPVKGSQAAQDRKQLLQKQIPIHDIDPTFCHELSNEELKQMNDYITHVKQTSVGIGQIVSLSNIIKANLHMLNPSEAALIASRYPKGIPLAEIVKLQSQSRANALKQQSLSQKLDKLSLQDPSSKSLPNLTPNLVHSSEENVNPWVSHNVRDVTYPGYTKDINQPLTNVQFSGKLRPGQNRNYFASHRPDENIDIPAPTLDERFSQNPNFDPKNIPSQFIHQTAFPRQPRGGEHNIPYDENLGYKAGDQPNSAFVPYNRIPSGSRPGEKYIEENPAKSANYSSVLPGRVTKSPSGYRPGEIPTKDMPGHPETGFIEHYDPLDPNFAKNLAKYPSGHKNPTGDQSEHFANPESRNVPPYGTLEELKKSNIRGMPNYVPGRYTVYAEIQSPTKIPKNVKDLAFSTYDSDDPNMSNPETILKQNDALTYENYPPIDQYLGRPEDNPYGMPTDRYPDYNSPLDHENTPYNAPYIQKSIGLRPGQYAGYENDPSKIIKSAPNDENRQGGSQGNHPFDKNIPYKQQTNPYLDNKHIPLDQTASGQNAAPNAASNTQDDVNRQNVPHGQYDQPSGVLKSGQYGGPGSSPSKSFGHSPVGTQDNVYGQSIPQGQRYQGDSPGSNIASQGSPYGTRPTKKLSELHPGKISINEDYLQPSQVTIGAIQDINYPEIKAATQGTNDFYEDYSPDSLREILNNVKLPDCHYCKKPFEENEFAITIDRANVLFHAQCFKCAGCNQILADNVYFYNKETDNVYCGRDYAKIRGFPRCKACDELIFTKEYCLAENSTFHLKHFCCIECDKPLAGQDYTLEDSMPYCLPCFEQSKASKCSACGRVIKPDEVGCNLKGVHFHAVDECFACKVCKKPLMGQKLLLRNEKLYCSHDCFGIDSTQ